MERKNLVKAVGRNWEILVKLYDRERFASELAEALGKKPPAISKAARELVGSGLIEVRLSPQERGGVRRYYHLTDRGRVIVEAILHAKKVPERRKYTEAEVKILVAHGRQLKHSLLYLLKGPHVHSYYISGEEVYNPEVATRYMPNMLSHLKTGYPELYKLYEERQELQRRRDEAEERMEEQIKTKAEKKFKDVLPSTKLREDLLSNFAAVAVDRLRALHRGYESFVDEDDNWKLKEGMVHCGGYGLLHPAEQEDLEEARRFVTEVSNELLEAYREVIELQNKHYEKCKALESKLTDLLKLIESEIPLRGYCNVCEDMPRIQGARAD